MPTLTMTRAQREEIIAHAREGWPYEVCGILAGDPTEGLVQSVYRVTNILHSEMRYQMDPEEQLRHYKTMREKDEEEVAYYHSHPKTRAYPSPTDVGLSYPGVFYVLVSLEDAANAQVRAYTIPERQLEAIEEHPIELLD